MIPNYLLITNVVLDISITFLSVWSFFTIRKLQSGFAWQLAAADRANANYRKNRQALLERNDQLQRQLEVAETKWGEAISQNKWHEREMDLFLQKYKDLEEQKAALSRGFEEKVAALHYYQAEREELQAQLKKFGERCMQLENDNKILNSKNDPHAFPM